MKQEQTNQNNQVPPILKIQSVKELAVMYGVHPKTFANWLKPFKEELGKKMGWYFNVNQVKIIYIKLGYPNRPIDNTFVNLD